MSKKIFCPICKIPFEISESNRIPCPTSSLSNSSKQWIAFCQFCELGILYPTQKKEETSHLYEGGSFWGKVSVSSKIQNYAMPYALAEARLKFILENSALKSVPSLKILDIGAGHGCFGMVAAKYFCKSLQEYAIVEPDPRMLQRLEILWEKNVGGLLRLQATELLEKIEGRFDLIVISHVLEHLDNPKDLLSKAKNLLKSQGHIFIEVPHLDYRYKSDVLGHVLFFSPKQLELLLSKVGFNHYQISVFGKNYRTTPMNPKTSKTLRGVEKTFHKLRKFLPYPVLSKFYRLAYGIESQNKEGTWIRALTK